MAYTQAIDRSEISPHLRQELPGIEAGFHAQAWKAADVAFHDLY